MLSIYKAASTLAAPVVGAAFSLRPTWRPLRGRLHPKIDLTDTDPVWIHACSVGEVNAAQPLIDAVTARFPAQPVLLTTSTVTGYEHARAKSVDRYAMAWFPIDSPAIVRRFVQEAKPIALVLVETELWPNVLDIACGVMPVGIVNGRISDQQVRRYAAVAPLFRRSLERVAVAAMQHEDYAQRFEAMGIRADALRITGSLKFDGAPIAPDAATWRVRRTSFGLSADDRVVVWGSTRPGDEAIARRAWERLVELHWNLKFVVAPRHPDRTDEALAAFAGIETHRYSKLAESELASGNWRVLFLDTLGKLNDIYSLAEVAVVGGGFSSRYQGQNPIEPAALGVPAILGPHMRNFRGATEILTRAGAAIQVERDADVSDALNELLSDSNRRTTMGQAGISAVAANRGASERTLDALVEVIEFRQTGA